MDLFGRRKKREEEEKLEQIREQQIERNRIKKEDEEKRWKELEIQYGVSREELRYQLFDDMYTYWRPSDGKQKLTAGHIGVIGWVKRNTHEPEKSEYVEEEFQFKWIDLNMLLDSKPNKNILTCGESGAGKSTLNRFLLQHISDDGSNRIIFMFKPADHYLKAGYPVADMSILAPNPFLDPDSFVSAFAIAFPISMIGITASQIPSLVRDLVFGCTSWNDFNRKLASKIKETSDKVQLTALYFIQQQIKTLQLGKTHSEENPINLLIQNGTSIVVDFSKLSADSTKVFHAELLLRQIWSNMPKDRKLVICVDEAHRLTRGTFEKYHSVLYEIGREIRARGALWASTQNYCDIDDDIRNQFATQFVFHTSSKADLDSLRAIDPMLSWAVAGLRPHRFIDAKSAEQLHYEIHILTFSPEGLIEIEPVSVVEYLASNASIPQHKKTIVDYEAAIKEKLVEEPIWISGIANYLSDSYGVDKDSAKLKVKDILQKLVNADEVRRMKFEMLSGENVVLYFRKSGKDENESPFHKWMVRQAVENSEGDSEIIHVATSGESKPDVELDSFFIECETSLKKRTDDLEERIKKFSCVKPMIIIVPNSDSIQLYQRLASERVIVTTFKNYKQSIRSKARP